MTKPKISLTVQERDLGWKKIKAELDKAKGGAFARVGYLGTPESERREDGPLGNVAIALVHEFGSPAAGVPERSHLRASFDKHKAEYEAMLARLAAALFSGKLTVEKAVSLVGIRAANDVKAFIRAGVPPPNAPATIALKQALGRGKGAVKTLIDTGRMLASLDFETVLRGFQVLAKKSKE